MCRNLIISLIGLLLVSHASASDKALADNSPEQNSGQWHIGITLGATMIQPGLYDFDFIRARSGGYYNWTDLDAQSQVYNVGLSVERRFPDSRLALSSGIRYTTRLSMLGTQMYDFEQSEDYFYVVYNEEGQQTEMARVTSISEELTYLSIPLELRIYPMKPGRFNFFFGFGTEYGHLLYSESSVNFHAEYMNPLTDEITELFNKPSDFFLSGYGTIGFMVTKSHFSFRLQGILPAFYLNENISGIVSLEEMRGGIQLGVSLPL